MARWARSDKQRFPRRLATRDEDRQGTQGPRGTRERSARAALRAATVAVVIVSAWFASSPPPAPIDAGGRAQSPPESLVELPTRGSLAGDHSWLAALSRLEALADLPAERHVAFAGDLHEARVALALGDGPGGQLAAWLTGPVGASPHRMSLAAPPTAVDLSGPIALWDTPASAWLGGVLVVVTMPGDAIGFLGGIHVDAYGFESRMHRRLTAVDGVATVAVGPPVATHLGGAVAGRVLVTRDGTDIEVPPVVSDRTRRLAESPIEPADPRGLRAGVDEQQLQGVLHEMVGTYGLRPRQVSPILLAAGPADDDGAAVLVGATLPSGATVAWLSVMNDDGDAGNGPLSTKPAPTGTALLDRVVAVWTNPGAGMVDGLRPMVVVSGPRDGAVAEALAADGSRLAHVRLAEGAGVAAIPAESTAIRVRDAEGEVLAEAPIARPTG